MGESLEQIYDCTNLSLLFYQNISGKKTCKNGMPKYINTLSVTALIETLTSKFPKPKYLGKTLMKSQTKKSYNDRIRKKNTIQSNKAYCIFSVGWLNPQTMTIAIHLAKPIKIRSCSYIQVRFVKTKRLNQTSNCTYYPIED